MVKHCIFPEDLMVKRCLPANLGVFYVENTVLSTFKLSYEVIAYSLMYYMSGRVAVHNRATNTF